MSSPLVTTVGTVPPLPLLTALPVTRPPGWSIVVFLLPLTVGGMVGLVCREASPTRGVRLRAVAVATGVTATALGALAAVISGHVASGPFDPLTVPAGPLVGCLIAWIGFPAALLAGLPRRTRKPAPRRSRYRVADGERRPEEPAPERETGGDGWYDDGTWPEAEYHSWGEGELDGGDPGTHDGGTHEGETREVGSHEAGFHGGVYDGGEPESTEAEWSGPPRYDRW